MAMSLDDALKRCGYRENLDCRNVKILNLEMDLDSNAEEQLENLGIEVFQHFKRPDVNDDMKLHSLQTTAMIEKYLLNAKVSLYPNSSSAYAEWLEEYYNIVGLSISAFNTIDENQKKMSKECYMMASAGNRGALGVYKTDKWFDLCGACDVDLNMRSYSSFTGGTVDYVGIDGFNFLGEDLYGTSYSRPFTKILVAQYYQLFYNKYKVFPTPLQTHHFIKDNCIDIDEKGFDIKSGNGLFILPSDDKIKFFKYVDIPERIINAVTINDEGFILANDIGFDLHENSNFNASLLAYMVRRKMESNRIGIDRVFFNVRSMNHYKFREYVENPSILTLEMERGHK